MREQRKGAEGTQGGRERETTHARGRGQQTAPSDENGSRQGGDGRGGEIQVIVGDANDARRKHDARSYGAEARRGGNGWQKKVSRDTLVMTRHTGGTPTAPQRERDPPLPPPP
jgi:hypothetical protein